jgi:tripeptidyl-peptidase-1
MTLACGEYSVPQSIKHHIDIITPTLHFAMKLNDKRKRDHARALAPTPQIKSHPMATQPTVSNSDASFNYSICAEVVFPQCLRALYKMPLGTMDKLVFFSTHGIMRKAVNKKSNLQ